MSTEPTPTGNERDGTSEKARPEGAVGHSAGSTPSVTHGTPSLPPSVESLLDALMETVIELTRQPTINAMHAYRPTVDAARAALLEAVEREKREARGSAEKLHAALMELSAAMGHPALEFSVDDGIDVALAKYATTYINSLYSRERE